MGRTEEKAPAATGAGTDNDTAESVVYSDNTTVTPPSQPSDNGQELEVDYLAAAFGHACDLMDNIELGLTDLIKPQLAQLDRVRTAHLTKAENGALNGLIGEELTRRPPGVKNQIISLLDLDHNYDELAELAAAVGILQHGATWAELLEHIGPISWAWPAWLPNGFLTITAGEPGQGKSILCLRIAATFLRGDPWPNGEIYEGEPGAIVWAEAEAAQALNLERARAWGLPLEKIYTPLDDPLADIQLDLTDHQEALTALATRPDVGLVIVDSLRGIHRGDENSSGSMEVVKWLAELARDTRKPIILTHHLRKRGMLDVGDRVNLERIRGSSAIIQAARMVWAIDCPDLTDQENKRLSVIKSNLARFPDPLGFTIGDEMHMEFGAAPEAPQQETQIDRAIDLLLAVLDDGPMWANELKEEAEGAGISWMTMKRAKDKLNLVARRDGRLKKWAWSLPAKDYTD